MRAAAPVKGFEQAKANSPDNLAQDFCLRCGGVLDSLPGNPESPAKRASISVTHRQHARRGADMRTWHGEHRTAVRVPWPAGRLLGARPAVIRDRI
ncbi:hypothetical protein GCM10022284_02380 [Streptomyces hundungensis]